MKTATTALIVGIVTILTGSGSSNELTNSEAARVLAEIPQVKKGIARVEVNGVRIGHEMGGTIAEITLSNFGYVVLRTPGQRDGDYSGPAEATFEGYTDGRWVLKKLQFKDAPFLAFEFNITAGETAAETVWKTAGWQVIGVCGLVVFLIILFLVRKLRAPRRTFPPPSS